MSLLLDTSIIVKLIVEEPDSQRARTRVKESLEQGHILLSVDEALPEALNTLWKHHRIHRDLDAEEATRAAEDLLILWDKMTIIPSREIAVDALQIAIELKTSIYDSLFLAASRKTTSTLHSRHETLRGIQGKI